MKRFSWNLVFVVAIALWLSAPAAFSADIASEYDNRNQDYPTGAGHKLGRGISNLAFGWLEIPKGIEDVGEEHNFFAGVTWGPLSGIGNAVKRTVLGAYEVVTFPIPAPANFDSPIQPEFVTEDRR